MKAILRYYLNDEDQGVALGDIPISEAITVLDMLNAMSIYYDGDAEYQVNLQVDAKRGYLDYYFVEDGE